MFCRKKNLKVCSKSKIPRIVFIQERSTDCSNHHFVLIKIYAAPKSQANLLVILDKLRKKH